MGYWKCPKYGAKDDTYEGTEIVSEQKPSGGFVAVDTEFGMVGGKPSGESTHKHLTVRKCRKCDIILSDKDYFRTAEDDARDLRDFERNRSERLAAQARAYNESAREQGRQPGTFEVLKPGEKFKPLSPEEVEKVLQEPSGCGSAIMGTIAVIFVGGMVGYGAWHYFNKPLSDVGCVLFVIVGGFIIPFLVYELYHRLKETDSRGN